MLQSASEPSVLLVEDEMIVAMDIEHVLEDAGLRVVGHAVRGAEAVELFARHRPAICLVDLQLLDGAVGFECGRLFAKAGALVVYMTANQAALPPDLGGAYGVIAKPFTSAGLHQALDHLQQVVAGASAPAAPEILELAVKRGASAMEASGT